MKLKSIFRKKHMTEPKGKEELERTLTTFQLIMLGIGAIVGAGIFVIIGPAAGGHAGPAVTLSFILAALACACAGLCYAELSSCITVSGSAYSYLYVSVGEIVAWLVAGMIFLTYFMGGATVASGWSSYFVNLLSDYDIFFPMHLADSYGSVITLKDGSTITAWFDLPAAILVLALTYVLYAGTSASAILNTILVIVKMFVLLLFIGIGFFNIDVANYTPYIPENTGVFGEFGVSGIVGGAALLLFAYAGFDTVATAAQEVKNPQKAIPRGILGSLIIVAITYIAIAIVLTGVVNYTMLNNGQPMAVAADIMGIPWFQIMLKLGALIGLPSVILVEVYAIVRVFYAMTRDGLLPKSWGKVSKKTHTPYRLTFGIGGILAITSGLFPLDHLAKLSNFGGATTFILVCYATLYLRYTQPKLKRDFKVPFVPVIAIVGIVLFAQILFSLASKIALFAAWWIGIMLALYFLYGYRKSVLREFIHDHYHPHHPHHKKHK